MDKPFLMPIEDVFSISGRGTVVTGRVERGIIHVGDTVEIVGIRRPPRRCARVSRCSASCLTRVRPATTSACCCAGPSGTRWSGARWSAPGSITPHTKFKAECYILSKEEGWRHTPFFNGYRPQFYFRTTDVTGILNLPEGVEMVMPGDNVTITGEPDHPDRHGKRTAVCDSRRRTHRRRRRSQRNYRIREKEKIP
jgi:elongation factor Tu